VTYDHLEVLEEETKVTVVTLPSSTNLSSSEDFAQIGDRLSGNKDNRLENVPQ
jgi:hypothetical protein